MNGERGNRLWGLMALFYDQAFKRFPPYRKLIEEIIKNLSSLPSSSIRLLDAGCGTGLLSIELARRGYIVLGVDRSPEMLKRAQKKKQKEKLDNLIFLEGDLNVGIDIQDHSFDRILFIHSLYLLNEPGVVLQNFSSALSVGSEILMCNPTRRLALSELCAGGWSFLCTAMRERGFLSIFPFAVIALAMGVLNVVIQHRKKDIYHCWSKEQIVDLLISCGFKVKWLRESCLANSHLLLCAVKEK